MHPDHASSGERALPWKAYAVFTLCATVFLYPFMRTLYGGSDEGTLLIGAVRILHGQVFARDFFEVMGPGAFYWLAGFFKVFGVSFLVARVGLFIPLLGTAVTLYFLSRRVCGRYRVLPCLMVAATYFGVLGQCESHHVDSNFFALLAVACMVGYLASARRGFAVGAGALAAITACTLQPKGVLLYGAFLIWLLLERRRIASPMLTMGLMTAGFAAVAGIAIAYFCFNGAWSGMVYANLTFPTQHYSGINTVPYAHDISEFWKFLTSLGDGAQWLAVVAAVLTVPFLFVAALPALTAGVGAIYKWKQKTVSPEIALYALCGAAIWLSEFHRRDIHHLAYGSPLLIVLFVHMLSALARNESGPKISISRLVKASAMVLTICAISLAGFECLMAAITGSVETRVGRAAIFGAGAATVLPFLNAHVQPGEDVLIYPYAPAYYFLAAANNPTRYSFLQYDYNTDAQFNDVVQTLEQRHVRYIVWDTNYNKNAVTENGPHKGNTNLILEPYIESHYAQVAQDHGILFMERR
jgi:4-amino-4-deoxy-L-arabinose transferase-like glycosyltransferase